MADKTPTPVTLIQNAQHQIIAVRIGDTVVPLLTCAMIPGAGCTNLTLTVANVAVSYEAAQA